jgi:hypothetical protein
MSPWGRYSLVKETNTTWLLDNSQCEELEG